MRAVGRRHRQQLGEDVLDKSLRVLDSVQYPWLKSRVMFPPSAPSHAWLQAHWPSIRSGEIKILDYHLFCYKEGSFQLITLASLRLHSLQCLPGYREIGLGFPGGSDNKQSACNAGDLGSTPGSGRSPREENGYPLQYSCLENSMDRGAWQATVHGIAKSQAHLSTAQQSACRCKLG